MFLRLGRIYVLSGDLSVKRSRVRVAATNVPCSRLSAFIRIFTLSRQAKPTRKDDRIFKGLLTVTAAAPCLRMVPG